MPSRPATSLLTTYDIVKTIAILLTVIDHIGFFFYPENYWFRVFGRACIPIWFFLVGYATSRNMGKDMWLWGGALLLSNFIFGGQIFPLNILVTIMAARFVLDRIARATFVDSERMVYSVVALTVLILPTMLVVEYGTAALMLALGGYAVRHSETLNIGRRAQQVFIVAAVAIYALSQILLFDFSPLEQKACAFLVGLTALMMYFFKPLELVDLTNRIPRFLTEAVQFTGRYTMEIYVVHLLLFKAAAAYYGLIQYGFFAWDWIR